MTWFIRTTVLNRVDVRYSSRIGSNKSKRPKNVLVTLLYTTSCVHEINTSCLKLKCLYILQRLQLKMNTYKLPEDSLRPRDTSTKISSEMPQKHLKLHGHGGKIVLQVSVQVTACVSQACC
jgi:hypothetical protein